MSADRVQTLIIWASIIGVSLTTFATRASFVLFASRLELPAIVQRALGYAPACALAAIMAPDLAYWHGHLALDAGNPRLLAGLAAAIAYGLTRSLVATIGIGMLAFTLLRLAG